MPRQVTRSYRGMSITGFDDELDAAGVVDESQPDVFQPIIVDIQDTWAFTALKWCATGFAVLVVLVIIAVALIVGTA